MYAGTTSGPECRSPAIPRQLHLHMRCRSLFNDSSKTGADRLVRVQYDLALITRRVRCCQSQVPTSVNLTCLRLFQSIAGIGDVVASNVNIGGHQWNLKYGPNSNWEVFSFITAEGDINDYSGDLNDFFRTSSTTRSCDSRLIGRRRVSGQQ